MKGIRFLAAFLSLALVAPAHAGTAVCKDAKGHVVGQRGAELHGQRFSDPDGMSGVTFIISWEKGSASVTTADERFNRNLKHQATLVRQTSDQVVLVTVDSSDVAWLYSVFPKERIALISSHGADASSPNNAGAAATSLLATCTVSE